MPRTPRHFEPNATYHLISRFVDREWFIQRESEREDYTRLLGRALRRCDWRLMAFAIMSNHIHLAVVAGLHSLDSWIRCVHSPFADAMNRTYGRIGPMFARGPKAKLVEPSGVGHLIAYIHNNPVRAGLCDAAAGSSWTSHRAYTGATLRPPWLDVSEGMRQAGFDDRAAFDTWVAAPERREMEHLFAETSDTNAEDESDEEESACGVEIPLDVLPALIVEATADVLDVPRARLCSTLRGPRESSARAVAVHVASRFGIRGQHIASALHISPQRVSVLRRDEPTSAHAALCERVIELVVSSKTDSSETSGPQKLE